MASTTTNFHNQINQTTVPRKMKKNYQPICLQNQQLAEKEITGVHDHPCLMN